MYGTFNLEVGFDPTLYFDPDNSTTLKVMAYGDKYFPTYNETKGLIIINICIRVVL